MTTRARIVLACAEPCSINRAMAARGLSALTVGKWRGRFAQQSLAGLADAPRSGAPRAVPRKVYRIKIGVEPYFRPAAMHKHYSFVTDWLLDADIASVWDCIMAVEQWPEWWPAVRAVSRLDPGDAAGIGAVTRFTWRGRLPYCLTFDMRLDEIVRHRRLRGAACGELRGTGVWHFSETPGGTHVRYDWQVCTEKPWMNLLAPLFAPAFRWNHDHVMALGGAGMARRLGCRLRAARAAS